MSIWKDVFFGLLLVGIIGCGSQEVRYEPEAAAYLVAIEDPNALRGTFRTLHEWRFQEYAAVWRAITDLGDFQDGRESFMEFVASTEAEAMREMAPDVFARLTDTSAGKSETLMTSWINPKDDVAILRTCRLAQSAVYHRSGGFMAHQVIFRDPLNEDCQSKRTEFQVALIQGSEITWLSWLGQRVGLASN